MPPGHHSSHSHSSHSHSSHHSSSHSSSHHSSHSHSSSYSSRSYTSTPTSSSNYSRNTRPLNRLYIPKGAPSHIRSSSIHLVGKKHTYIYYASDWTDEATGAFYQKGYYDETNRHYEPEELSFKNEDGSYTAHFTCNYCGSEADFQWKEGEYPHCSNCGAVMDKTTTLMDELVSKTRATTYDDYTDEYSSSSDSNNQSTMIGFTTKILIAVFVFVFGGNLIFGGLLGVFGIMYANYVENHTNNVDTRYEYDNSYTPVTNIDIYGKTIYLDEVGNNVYVICESTDEYEKKLTWDYGADSYYDRDSDCYIWYNTDVAPNLWQYWYEDIAGSNEYGWMECEGNDWYIEVSDTEYSLYTGDTSKLWHIQNEFDE